jgi:hypothetical protein
MAGDYFGGRYFPEGYFPPAYFQGGEEDPPGTIYGIARGTCAAAGTATATGHLSSSLTCTSTGTGTLTNGAEVEPPVVVATGGGGDWVADPNRRALPVFLRGTARGQATCSASIGAIAHVAGVVHGTSEARGTGTLKDRTWHVDRIRTGVAPIARVRTMKRAA